MNNQHEIVLLKNQEIDYDKWDNCIQNSDNGNLYAKSWYLDIVSPNWQALVLGDYEFVMPLTIKRKFGISAILQPLHCQQLGIFPLPDFATQQKFSQKLFDSFRIIQYQLNSEMDYNAFLNFKLQKKTNFILPLSYSYEIIYSHFSTNTKRNIKAAEKLGVRVIKGLAQSDFFRYKEQSVERKIPKKSYQILNQLMSSTIANGQGTIYAAYSNTNELCAAAFIIFDGNKAYYLNAFSTSDGKENKAMYAIVNELIKELCQNDITIDFEGSMIEGVARFYRGFGSLSHDYYFLSSTRLPFIGTKNRTNS